MRFAAHMIVATGLVLLTAHWQRATAQYLPQYGNMNRSYGPQQGLTGQPALNPYLNLVRGNNPAIGLFLGANPEVDRRAFQSGILSALPALEGYTSPGQLVPDIYAIPALQQTGHLSAFQAYGSYYGYGAQTRPYYPLNPNQSRTLPRQ